MERQWEGKDNETECNGRMGSYGINMGCQWMPWMCIDVICQPPICGMSVPLMWIDPQLLQKCRVFRGKIWANDDPWGLGAEF